MAAKVERLAALDIGTSNIDVLVGEVMGEGQLRIMGHATQPSRGLRKGVIINIGATVASIRQALSEAEAMAGCDITHVVAGISGSHIKGFNSHGVVAVRRREITQIDLDRVMDAAKAVAIPTDREILHVLPQEFIIDSQDGIKEPRGMSGVRLEARVHMVTGAVSSAQNLVKCAHQCGLQVEQIVLEPLASSQAVLSKDERSLGVALLDIGGGTTDLAVWRDGSIVHTHVWPIGGDHLTNDLALGLRTPLEEAERIKRSSSCSRLYDASAEQEHLSVASVGGRAPRLLSKKLVTDILEPRVREIFTLVRENIAHLGLADLMASGVVLTGGTSLLPGMGILAEHVFGVPVRLGVPTELEGMPEVLHNPIHATGVGLLLHAAARKQSYLRTSRRPSLLRATDRMRSWLSEVF